MPNDTEKQSRHRVFRIVRNTILFLLIIAVCAVLYFERDSWVPRLEGSLGGYNSITQNDGELAEGNFPLTISGNSGYDVNVVGESLFILHGSYLNIYSVHGDAQDTRQHAYNNAAMTSAGKYALIYERGGTSFRLDGKNKNIYTKTLDDDIISGVVSDSGTVALILESTSYACSIVIFDNEGNQIYQRNCIDHVVDICFRSDDNGCFFTTIDVNNGVLQSAVTSIQFDQLDQQWTSLPLDTMVVETNLASSNTLCVLGNTAIAYYDKSGEILGTYEYSDTLIQESVENGKAALLLQDDLGRKTSLVLLNQSVEEPVIVDVDDSAKYISVSDGDVYVMYDDSIIAYDFSGTPLATVSLSGSYTSFSHQGGYIFLFGYNQIDRVDFKE